MPTVSVGGNPFPTIESVMNLARVRVNDAMNDISGDLLTDAAPYSQTMLSSAWRWLQGRAATAGVETYIREIVISGFPLRASQDIANQAWLGWTGSGDGVNLYATPALPQDLILPLTIWRRPSNNSLAMFELMTQAEDGLPRYFDFNVYDWRDDGIYVYACDYAQDFRIRYSAFRADLVLSQPTNPVPMMMCEDCLSARIAYEFANLRGASQAPAMAQMAEDAFQTIAQRTSRRKQRQTIRRIPYGSRIGGIYW